MKKKKPMKKDLQGDIREQSSGCKSAETGQLEDSKKTKNTIPKILCAIFFFSYSSESLDATVEQLQSELFSEKFCSSFCRMTHRKC